MQRVIDFLNSSLGTIEYPAEFWELVPKWMNDKKVEKAKILSDKALNDFYFHKKNYPCTGEKNCLQELVKRAESKGLIDYLIYCISRYFIENHSIDKLAKFREDLLSCEKCFKEQYITYEQELKQMTKWKKERRLKEEKVYLHITIPSNFEVNRTDNINIGIEKEIAIEKELEYGLKIFPCYIYPEFEYLTEQICENGSLKIELEVDKDLDINKKEIRIEFPTGSKKDNFAVTPIKKGHKQLTFVVSNVHGKREPYIVRIEVKDPNDYDLDPFWICVYLFNRTYENSFKNKLSNFPDSQISTSEVSKYEPDHCLEENTIIEKTTEIVVLNSSSSILLRRQFESKQRKFISLFLYQTEWISDKMIGPLKEISLSIIDIYLIDKSLFIPYCMEISSPSFEVSHINQHQLYMIISKFISKWISDSSADYWDWLNNRLPHFLEKTEIDIPYRRLVLLHDQHFLSPEGAKKTLNINKQAKIWLDDTISALRNTFIRIKVFYRSPFPEKATYINTAFNRYSGLMSDISSGDLSNKLTDDSHCIIGIDIGGTYSTALYNQVPIKHFDNFFMRTTQSKLQCVKVSSVLSFDSDGRLLAGESAKKLIGCKPEPLRFTDVKNEIGNQYVFKIGDKRIDPEKAYERLFFWLKEHTENKAENQFTKTVIAVPVHFNKVQISKIKKAAEKAGLKGILTIKEPVAVTLAYQRRQHKGKKIQNVLSNDPFRFPPVIQNKKHRNTLICDIGGSASKVTILKNHEIIKYNLDRECSGEVFDDLLSAWLVGEMTIRGYTSWKKTDRKAVKRLLNLAEKAKIRLSEKEHVKIDLKNFHISDTCEMTNPYELNVYRKIFETIIDEYINKIIHLCKKTMKDAEIDIEDLDDILPVGGGSNIPLVIKRLKLNFGDGVRIIDPDFNTATGAFIHGFDKMNTWWRRLPIITT